ncbi:restriction endonuclease subunit S [Coraliomargarita parva]|uniref:restriction endonuclease subunit S n=1 Tax=Coraliomargarita parva TaxID=3014050 RepID=UPI0022B59682|nr:restriction endonuclease subunit S [Coraliomargarita parva]
MSFPRYTKYKDSGVEWLGEVPEHWELKPLWTAFRRVKRTGYPEEELLSVYRDLGVIPKASRDDNFNKPSDDLGGYQLVEAGDLAINKMKAWQGSVAISEYRGIVSPAYFVLNALHEENSRYLHYLMRSPRYITGYLSNSKGIRVNQWDLQPELHTRMLLTIPSREEQDTIAAFLDRETAKIDALVAEQRRLMELLKEKRQAVISHAVTKGLNPDAPMKPSGIEWLGDVPEHWEVGKLKRWIAGVESGTSVNAADEPASDGQIGVLKTSSVYTGKFDPNENKVVVESELDRVSCPLRINSLIVSRMNTPELVGAAGLVVEAPDNIFLPDRLWQVTTRESVSEFVYLWTLSNLYRGQIQSVCTGTSSSMKNLSQDQFGSLIVCCPPCDEQREIVEVVKQEVEKLDTLTAEAQRAIDLLQERRTAIISSAVTGQIDVREVVPT